MLPLCVCMKTSLVWRSKHLVYVWNPWILQNSRLSLRAPICTEAAIAQNSSALLHKAATAEGDLVWRKHTCLLTPDPSQPLGLETL